MPTVISVENLSKTYRLGQIGTGTLTNDLKVWWARVRGKPNPLLKIGQEDQGNRDGEILWALKDVSFQVEQGEVLGIIGRNGAGKSTLLKILSRVTAPTSGQIKVKGRIASLLEVGTGFHPELTGRENIYLNGAILGMSRKEIDRKFDEIVDFAEVEQFIDTPVKRYSSGMYVRLAFAVAAHLESEILLVDEVLAVGDAEFQKKCLGKMGDVASKEGRTVLFVSHNMEAILHLCTKAFYIDRGIIKFSGHTGETVKAYLLAFTQKSTIDRLHVVYESNTTCRPDSPIVNRIEILDLNHQPKNTIYTWDDLIIRIHYSSPKEFLKGTFIVDVYDYKQQRLVVFDSGLKLPISEGNHFIDLSISNFALSAGEYFLGVGLALANAQFLWRQTNAGLLRIFGKDVFNIGRPPEYSRMIFALQHDWKNDASFK